MEGEGRSETNPLRWREGVLLDMERAAGSTQDLLGPVIRSIKWDPSAAWEHLCSTFSCPGAGERVDATRVFSVPPWDFE